VNGSWNNILLRVPTVWYGSPFKSTSAADVEDDFNQSWNGGRGDYHAQSHLFGDLEPHSRYEVIVQTKNQFGWSEPTPSFVFSTRLMGQ